MNMDYEFKNRGNLRMDIFSEQIIKRKFCAKDALIITASVIVAVIILLLTLAIPLLSMFAILILAGVCFAFYYMVTSIDWEFEYSITNHDFTCDKIKSRNANFFSIEHLHNLIVEKFNIQCINTFKVIITILVFWSKFSI